MILFRKEISACDGCGVCCLTPCLLSGYEDMERIAEFKGKTVAEILPEFQVEVTPNNDFQVRIRPVDGRCPNHINMKCSIHEAKPTGAKDFKCWDRATYESVYFWSTDDLKKIGFSSTL